MLKETYITWRILLI